MGLNGGISRFSYKNFIYRTSIILLVMVICSFWMVCDIFARFTSSGRAFDESRVASFNVQAYTDDEDAVIKVTDEEVTENYTFVVNNRSEVIVKYKVVIDLEESLPEGIEIKINGKSHSLISSDRKEIVYENLGNLYMGEVKNCVLDIIVNRDDITENETGLNFEKNIKFLINVHFEQID